MATAARAESDIKPRTEKVAASPHFYQGDPRGHFEADGSNYCCPTAISDSLVYFAAHGFPNLLPDADDPAEAQAKLIRKLASSKYMSTDPDSGTDVAQACSGLRKYVEGAGYACRTIEYRGWRPGPKSEDDELPSLDWIKKAVADPRGAAWANVGWYVHGSKADEWKRVGGHWVTVVGYGTDGKGHADPTILLIDNPAKKGAVADVAAAVMTTAEVERGRLVGDYKGLPRDAAGMYRVGGPGIGMSKKYAAAFIDGAVVTAIGERRR